MVKSNDWRLMGQEVFLKGVQLQHKVYSVERTLAKYKNWDHDHCEFCGIKFPHEVKIGYCTLDEYYWICEECYNDFKEMFEWEENTMYKEIDVYENMNTIMKELEKGVLLTTKKDGKVNTMTIAWGAVGLEWGKLEFIALVRQSRYTLSMLESGEFTVNIPMDGSAKKALGYCGTKSGRDTDKIADLGLTLVDGQKVSVPAIKELPMTLECKVIYEQKQDENAIPDDIKSSMYPDGDFHTMFFGEIVAAYILE